MEHELNISEMRQRLDNMKQEAERSKKVSRFLSWGITALFVGSTLGPLVAIGSRNRNAASQFNVIIDVLWVVVIIGLAVSVYRSYHKWATTFNQYIPEFVPRAHWLDLGGVLFSTMWVWTVISVLFILRVDFLVILVFILLSSVLRRASNFFFKAIYRGGSKWSNRWLRLFPHSSTLLNMQAVNLLHEGDFEAAEKIFRQMLAHKQRPNFPTVALWLNNLGYCLTLGEKYEEAYPYLVAAIQIAPDIPNSYDSLASWYLEQKVEPEKALELAEMALANGRPETKDSVCVQQATGAYAAALTGRVTRAQALLELATAEAKKQSHPALLAEVNRQTGYAYLALNKPEVALGYFKKALDIDPHGLYGKLAQRALESIASSGLQAQAYS